MNDETLNLFKDDFAEFLNTLNKYNVKYLIIGAYATMMHTKVMRTTKDLDIWVEQSEENALKLSKALKEFTGTDIPSNTFLIKGQRLEIGEEPFKIEVWTSQETLHFDEAWDKKIESSFGNVSVYLISKEHLIQLKKYFGRHQDLQDLELLQQEKK
jgi:predicted nucleotidyltransferase